MRSIILPIVAALMLFSLSGCRKIPINGDLDAQWQIMSVHYADGQTFDPEGTLYICISLHTLQLEGRGNCHTASMSYDSESGRIILNFPYSEKSEFAPWGFSDSQTGAQVIRLNRKELVLLTDIAEIVCRRF